MTLKLGELEVEISGNTSGLKKAESEVKTTGKNIEASFNKVGAAITAALSVEAARQVILIADKMTRLEGTIKRLTRTTGDFNKVWSELGRVSDENGIAISDSVALFQRFQSALGDLTTSNQDVISFIDNLQKLGRIGGSSAEELSNALTQLSQGLAGGIIRAEEFNSVMEQAPEIMRSVAKNIDGVDGNIGKLRDLMLDGRLTAEQLFTALQKGASDTNAEFAELPRTIDMASKALSNNFAKAVAELDKQIGGSKNIAKFFDFLSGEIGEFAAGAALRPLKIAKSELIELDKKIQKVNESTAKRAELEKALSEAQSPQARAAIQKSLDSQSDTESQLIKLQEQRIAKLKEIEELQNKPIEPAVKGKPKVANAGFEGPQIDDKTLTSRQDQIKKEEEMIQASLDEIFMMNKSQKEKLLALEAQQLDNIDDLYLRGKVDYETAEQAKIEIGKSFAKQRADLEVEVVDETAKAYDQLSKTIGDELGGALAKTKTWSDAMKAIIADLASQFIQAGLSSAFGGQTSGNNIFAGLFTSAAGAAMGGGRAMGGTTSGSLTHPINERGIPEVLNQAGKQYLLPTGKNGTITPLSQGSNGGAPNISMINMGTPMDVQGVQITEGQIEIMINDKLGQYDKSLEAQLAKANSKKGQSFQRAFKLETNTGR